jgi:hypothetical protein
VLFAQAVARRQTGDHVVEVKVYSPKGNLYQSISIPFTASAVAAGAERRLEGYPEPVAVQKLGPITVNGVNSMAVKVTLPVAGTPVVNNSLYGTWKVNAFVDGAATFCKGSFAITR